MAGPLPAIGAPLATCGTARDLGAVSALRSAPGAALADRVLRRWGSHAMLGSCPMTPRVARRIPSVSNRKSFCASCGCTTPLRQVATLADAPASRPKRLTSAASRARSDHRLRRTPNVGAEPVALAVEQHRDRGDQGYRRDGESGGPDESVTSAHTPAVECAAAGPTHNRQEQRDRGSGEWEHPRRPTVGSCFVDKKQGAGGRTEGRTPPGEGRRPRG